jgi:protein involved in polysaccharide export with SLBB domain
MKTMLTVFALLVLVGCTSVPIPHTIHACAPRGQQVLSVGESVFVCNRHHIEHTAENLHVISADGSIRLPLLGKFNVAGLTPHDAADAIATSYRNKNIFNRVELVVVREREIQHPGAR